MKILRALTVRESFPFFILADSLLFIALGLKEAGEPVMGRALRTFPNI
jgi:hypothetical protein